MTTQSIFTPTHYKDLIHNIQEPLYIVKAKESDQLGLVNSSHFQQLEQAHSLTIVGMLPPLLPENLGDKIFLKTHGIRFPYIVGEMANGIATTEMVIAAAKAGMLGFFGAAGLTPTLIEKNLLDIKKVLGEETLN